MEIDETFLSLEEIKKMLENEGFTYKISFDGDENEDEESEKKEDAKAFEKWEKIDFSIDANPEEIKKWEKELPDIEEEEEERGEEEEKEEEKKDRERENEKRNGDKNDLKLIDQASVIYFDVFKKKTYAETFIFQKEGEGENKLYRLVGFCEAPMT